jgi:uncharacterized protein YndB with AHSA1/START domain
MSLTLSLDFQYTTTIEKLWSALTDSSKLAKWVANIHTGQPMVNDFKPVVGHRFEFRTQPNEYWDGIIEGEVLSWTRQTGCPIPGPAEGRSTRSPGRCRI